MSVMKGCKGRGKKKQAPCSVVGTVSVALKEEERLLLC